MAMLKSYDIDYAETKAHLVAQLNDGGVAAFIYVNGVVVGDWGATPDEIVDMIEDMRGIK